MMLVAASAKRREASDVHRVCKGIARHDPRDLSTEPAFSFWARRVKPRCPASADCITFRGPNCCCAGPHRDRAASGAAHETYGAASGKTYPPAGTAADKAGGATGTAYDPP